MIKKKYGVVYTPDTLAQFVASVLWQAAEDSHLSVKSILDPACGECALLGAAKKLFGANCNYIGIDVDRDAVNAKRDSFSIHHNDAILPQQVKRKSADYWKEKLPPIDAIIANPPWSTEKIYSKQALSSAGFSLALGQYDSYVLFIELAINILSNNGLFAFIIPDSLFDAQNEKLRRFLVEKTHIKVIARLGEKLFEEVNRATTVIVCQKIKPTIDCETICFRLSTEDRKSYLNKQGTLLSFFNTKKHTVSQSRFWHNNICQFDIDTHVVEEKLIEKITSNCINWNSTFKFGRGVEISKAGQIVICPSCNCAQGYKRKQLELGMKECSGCGAEIPVSCCTVQKVITNTPNSNTSPIYVGENIHRYTISGNSFIAPHIEGINYKSQDLYNPPKLLIRKTGLGIYCSLDRTAYMTSQTVYILTYANETNCVPLEYYLALINSRVVYYYYLKTYGENEWKSHPYLTKQIIYTLPIKTFVGDSIDQSIIRLSKKLLTNYDHNIDVDLERLIMEKYRLTEEERATIIHEINNLPNLSSINNMKMEV